MKAKQLLFVLGCVALTATSCVSSYYRSVTHVAPDGMIGKTIYALGDSAFMAGNTTHNPFLFVLNNDWQVTRFDSCIAYDFFGEKRNLNVKAYRHYSFEDETSVPPVREVMRPLAAPKETLKKQFRWFYTYYTFTAVYPEITDKGPIPLSRYLTEPQQALWLQGDMKDYQGMNGIELQSVLDDLEKDFLQWYAHSMYEISFDIVQHFDSLSEDKRYLPRLAACKDSLFLTNQPGREDLPDFSPTIICDLLDTHFHTLHFSNVKSRYAKEFEQQLEEKSQSIDLFDTFIQYELSLPGEILSANTTLYQDGALVWKVDAYRNLAADYTLTAQSRVTNVWAFIVTFGLLLGAIAGLVTYARSRYIRPKSKR